MVNDRARRAAFCVNCRSAILASTRLRRETTASIRPAAAVHQAELRSRRLEYESTCNCSIVVLETLKKCRSGAQFVEDRLRDMVCKGEIDLSTAQHEIATDWIVAYKKYFHTDRPL